MRTRLISIACMLPLVIFLFIGGAPLLVICLLISCAAIYEYYRGFEKLEIKASKALGFALILILYFLLFASYILQKDAYLFEMLQGMWISLALFASLLLIIFDKNHNILGPTYTLLGVLYIAYSLAYIFLLERAEHALVWLPIIIACMSDTGGFFGGMYFGKHRLAPVLSPKKTIEGAIGGVILGTLFSFLFCLLFFKGHVLDSIIMGIIGSILSELGDLTASAFKRKMGIKDYSNLIPGHGGVMDRVDSFIFTAPFVYYYYTVFIA